MIRTVEEQSFIPRDKVIKWLHIIMLFLCFIATVALFNNPSTGTKIIICFILIAYTITILTNGHTIKLIFKVGQTEAEKNYSNLREWKIEEPSPQSKALKLSPIYNNTNFICQNNQTESADNITVNKSTDRSQDIKNMSMSIYRSLSASGLSDSRLSRMKSSVRRQELKGHDLSDVFIFKTTQDMESSVISSQGSGIYLVDSQTYLSSKTEHFFIEAEERYEEVIKKRLKKDRKFIFDKYELILNFIKNLLKSYLNEHRFAIDKIKELSQEYFDFTLLNSEKSTTYDVVLQKSSPYQKKIPLNLLIYRLLLLKEEKIQVPETGLLLKTEKRLSSVQPRLQQSLRAMIRLGEVLGLDSTLLKSRFRENTKKFVEDYFAAIEMIQRYLNTDKKQEKNFETSSNALCYASKCKTFALYLIVKQFNTNLKYTGKIKFNDNLSLRYPPANNIEFDIVKRPGSEDPLIHFDLQVKKDGKRIDKYYCEPGERNFLSVLFFLLQQLSKKRELLSWNMDIKQLVNEMV